LRLGRAAAGPRGRASRRDRTWLILSEVAAIVVLAWPAVTVAALVYILVVGALSLAAVDLVGALVNRRQDPRMAAVPAAGSGLFHPTWTWTSSVRDEVAATGGSAEKQPAANHARSE